MYFSFQIPFALGLLVTPYEQLEKSFIHLFLRFKKDILSQGLLMRNCERQASCPGWSVCLFNTMA